MNTFYQNNVVTFQKPANTRTHSNHAITHENFTQKVTDLCLKHQTSKKWILVINNEKQVMSALSSQQNIDKSKILHINNHKVNVDAANIEQALSKGNCSAIVVTNNTFKADQISHLTACAKQTNTTFMVLDNVSGLH